MLGCLKRYNFSLSSLTQNLRASLQYNWAGRTGDQISVGVRFSAPDQTIPGAHPASYTMGTGLFPGGKKAKQSRWGRGFPPIQTGPGAHTASCKMDTGSFPGVKCGRGLLLTTHPLLVPRSWNSRAISLPTLWATPDL